MAISKRFLDRARPALRKYQKILEAAQARDVNESDTALIVSDILTDVLGYDKYSEITTEFAIRSTFCDLAVKRDGRVRYLIEVKSIGTNLRENHLSQAIAYGVRAGVEWVLLTNGSEWQAHRLRFEQPVEADHVFTIDLIDPDAKPAALLDTLFLLSKEAGESQIDRYWLQKEATSRYMIAQVLLSDAGLACIRRELRGLFKGLKVTDAELTAVLTSEVFKRDVLDGEKATAAQKTVRRAERRRQRAKSDDQDDDVVSLPDGAGLPQAPHGVAVES